MMSNIEDTNSSSLIDENVLAFELSEEAVFGVPLTNRTESEDNLPNTESLAETNDSPQQQETDSLLSISQSESDPSNSKLPKSKTPSRAVLAPDVTHVPIQPLDIVEYEWPCKSGDKFFLQEQISELLGINSFKRKYPELVRRTVEPAERDYLLKELKTNIALPSHHLTALHSVDVRELMSSEYPFEYAEYQKVCNERVKRSLLEKQKEMETIKLDARKMAEIRQKAVKSASEFNSELQFVRRTERQHFWEMNTNLVHSPLNKWMRLSAEHTKPSEFPVLLMPGQFTTYYKRFDSALLRSFPFGSVVKSDDLFRPKRDASPPAISISEKELEAAKSYNDTTNEQNSNNSNDKNGRKEHTFLDVDMEQLERNAMPKISQKEREMEQPPTKARKMSVTSTSSKFSRRKMLASPWPSNRRKVSISWTSSSVSKMALQKANATEVNKPRGYLQPQQQQKQGESEQKPGICSVCKSTEPSPAHKTSLLVRCSACRHQMHSSCIDMPLNMVEVIRKYDWLCIECKRCSVCEQPDQEAAMMCCDACDRGYHTFCIGVEMPPNGTWHCPKCKGTIMDEQLRKRYLSVKEPEQLMEGQQKVLYMDLESKPHEEFDGTFEMPQKKRKGRPPNKKT